MLPYQLPGFTWLPCATRRKTFVVFFFCSRASNRSTLLFLRNRKPMIRGTQSLLVRHHPIKQQGRPRITTSVVITGMMILLQQYKPALTTILHHKNDRCNSVLAKTLMFQSLRHLEIICNGLPHIIAPLVFSSASSLSHCFKQALRKLYALPARKSEFFFLFHFELHLDLSHGKYPQLSNNDSIVASSLPNSDVSSPNTPKSNHVLVLGNCLKALPKVHGTQFHNKYPFSNSGLCSKPL